MIGSEASKQHQGSPGVAVDSREHRADGSMTPAKVVPEATTRTVLAGAILLLGGIVGVADAFVQGSVLYFLGVGGATLLLAGVVDGTRTRYRGPGTSMLLTFVTVRFAFKWLPDKPWGMTQLKFLALCYAVLLAAYGLYVLAREAVRLRSRSSPPA